MQKNVSLNENYDDEPSYNSDKEALNDIFGNEYKDEEDGMDLYIDENCFNNSEIMKIGRMIQALTITPTDQDFTWRGWSEKIRRELND